VDFCVGSGTSLLYLCICVSVSLPRPVSGCDTAVVWLGGLCPGPTEGEEGHAGGPQDGAREAPGGQSQKLFLEKFYYYFFNINFSKFYVKKYPL